MRARADYTAVAVQLKSSMLAYAGATAKYEQVIGKRAANAAANPASTAVSKDAAFQVRLPAGWKTVKDLHDDADLQIKNEVGPVYLLVFSEPKKDFEKGTTYRTYDRLFFDDLRQSKHFKLEEGPLQLKIGGREGLFRAAETDRRRDNQLDVQRDTPGTYGGQDEHSRRE